jgi:hypothetical protein
VETGSGDTRAETGRGTRRKVAGRVVASSRPRPRLSAPRDLVAPVIGAMIYVAAGYLGHFQRGAIVPYEKGQ